MCFFEPFRVQVLHVGFGSEWLTHAISFERSVYNPLSVCMISVHSLECLRDQWPVFNCLLDCPHDQFPMAKYLCRLHDQFPRLFLVGKRQSFGIPGWRFFVGQASHARWQHPFSRVFGSQHVWASMVIRMILKFRMGRIFSVEEEKTWHGQVFSPNLFFLTMAQNCWSQLETHRSKVHLRGGTLGLRWRGAIHGDGMKGCWSLNGFDLNSRFQRGSRAADFDDFDDFKTNFMQHLNMKNWNHAPFPTWQIGVTLAFLQVSKLESHLASKNPLEILVLRHEFTANVGSVLSTIWLWLTVRHGKIHPFFIGKPSISMGHLYHGYMLVRTRLGIYSGNLFTATFWHPNFSSPQGTALKLGLIFDDRQEESWMGPEPRKPGNSTTHFRPLCCEANWEDVATNIKQRLRGKGPNPTLEKRKFCFRTRLSQLQLFLVCLRYFCCFGVGHEFHIRTAAVANATGGFQGEVEVRFDAQEDLKIYRFGRSPDSYPLVN